jgi:hypothetical protein
MQYFLQKKGWAIFWAIFHKLILSGVDVMITIFGKNGFFLKNQCYDQIFAKSSRSLRKSGNFYAEFFGENIF